MWDYPPTQELLSIANALLSNSIPPHVGGQVWKRRTNERQKQKNENNKTKEDDYGSADILITLNTGTIVMYIGLITSMIAIIGVGAYIIKKKVIGEI